MFWIEGERPNTYVVWDWRQRRTTAQERMNDGHYSVQRQTKKQLDFNLLPNEQRTRMKCPVNSVLPSALRGSSKIYSISLICSECKIKGGNHKERHVRDTDWIKLTEHLTTEFCLFVSNHRQTDINGWPVLEWRDPCSAIKLSYFNYSGMGNELVGMFCRYFVFPFENMITPDLDSAHSLDMSADGINSDSRPAGWTRRPSLTAWCHVIINKNDWHHARQIWPKPYGLVIKNDVLFSCGQLVVSLDFSLFEIWAGEGLGSSVIWRWM